MPSVILFKQLTLRSVMQVLPRASLRVAFSARCPPTTARRLSVSVMAAKEPIYGELGITVSALSPKGVLQDRFQLQNHWRSEAPDSSLLSHHYSSSCCRNCRQGGC